MTTQDELDQAMQHLAERRVAATNAKQAVYNAVAGIATAPYIYTEAVADKTRKALKERLKELEDVLRVANLEVGYAEDRVRTLEASTSRWRP